jgi:triosephosphate isomerase (TIM)
MNLLRSEAKELTAQLKAALSNTDDREIVICPTFTCLPEVSKDLSDSTIALGAQNMYFEKNGAFTGEISGLMLRDAGCHYVIIGHSERRQYFKESDDLVNKKVVAALDMSLIPIMCVGETLEEREAEHTLKVLEKQVKGGLKHLTKEQMLKIVIAYEPVWAIGTGKTATPAQAEEVHAFIRKLLVELFDQATADKIRILYGGSVKADNVDILMAKPNIDGALVGGAALKADSFIRIVQFKKS